MEDEREAIAQQQDALAEEEKALILEEAALWEEVNRLHWQDAAFQEVRDAGTAQIDAMERKEVASKSLNILTDMFVIGYNGTFGTINQFRMGQSASLSIEWNEINAAFGESALLLQTLADIVGLEFAEYVTQTSSILVVPLGSFSKMIRTSNLRMEYNLYARSLAHGSEQQNFAESHFNLGLGAWITCLGQLMAFMRAREPSIRLPYKVAKHSIGGYSVLYLKNKHKEWTKALKYALTNLKWLLLRVSDRRFALPTASSSSDSASIRKGVLVASTASKSSSSTPSKPIPSVVIAEHFA
ncbi:hypothetical protein BBJ28_00012677 [Nothophytophthora sp. Chile5]|nr:hypothetical protein BBJ28_00012677 [Nothophytophthora sp. Chile5]